MAVTLAVFAVLQIGLPLLVRPHLLPPVSSAFELSPSNVDTFGLPRDGTAPRVVLEMAIPGHRGAWVLSSDLVDPSGRPVGTDATGGTVQVSRTSGPCTPSAMQEQQEKGMDRCLAEINRLGYRQAATYHPFDRFWPFQWIETGIYALLTLGLTGFCFWWIRRRLS